MSRLRRVLAAGGWFNQAWALAEAVWENTAPDGGLIIVGSPPYVPCHLAGHLAGQFDRITRNRGGVPASIVLSMPHRAPHGCPDTHELPEATWRRVAKAGPGETVLVVAPAGVPTALLRHLAWAREMEATVASVDAGDPGLAEISEHRFLVRVPTQRPSPEDIARAELEESDLPLHGPVGALPMHLAEHLLAHALLRHGERPSLARRALSNLGVA